MQFEWHFKLLNISSCEEVDAVMVFVYINGNKERIDNYCGNNSPKQLMSNGPSLQVEFVTHKSEFKARGFRGIYRFVTSEFKEKSIYFMFTADFGITTGEQDEKRGVCTFVFNSETHPSSSVMSPNYPGLYPRDTECHYFFYGERNQRVHFSFAYFDVEGVPPCYAESASDYVEFSNYKTVDRKMQRHCGLKRPKKLASDREFFRITFKSNDKFDGTGFYAYYQFRNVTGKNNIYIAKRVQFVYFVD
ncbi:suppressor of lurcher protein 1-like protein [Leptotrombidium deliense]|uniref:Suppressor of lurcher protein 1-like protein n=1 Tax=Leptotrombidium deliense TaxID=299467 RepID=A0A443SLB8_9ACAR|nr:suppressor of lurcher protein 1-like protein [Leptotrombidium deliense]